MGDISKGVANTLQYAKNIYKKIVLPSAGTMRFSKNIVVITGMRPSLCQMHPNGKFRLSALTSYWCLLVHFIQRLILLPCPQNRDRPK
jgi:hypothetical protein